ncbi:LysR family transcriptional regulator [Archangium violaceum]|nr:LysR family transcriptional regulator [Archangium violaceum]
MDLNLLGLFIAVAETGSFSEAARGLGLPKSSPPSSPRRM